MRVVIISDFGSVNGGAAKVAIESARGLAEAGVEVVFACAIAADGKSVSERLTHPNIAVEMFGADEVWKLGSKLAAARQGIWNEAAHRWLAALLARQPAGTVAHLHQWTKAFSPAAIAAAGESGLPVVITMHDYFSFCPAGGYFDFQKGRPCDKSPMGAACVTTNCDRTSYAHKLVRVARQWRSDKALTACRDLTFIHVSEFGRRFAEPFLPAHARHVTVENMMEAGKRPAATIAANRHALFLGRFTQEKAADVLAAAALQAGMPVRFVGEGPLADDIRRINPQAEVRGWVSADKVFEEIAQARVLVAPSAWFETGPMTVMEAASVGVGAIVSRTMGAAEWVEDGVSGLHVPAGSVAGLAAALQIAQTEAAEGWGRNAHQRASQGRFSLERHVQALLAAYGGQSAKSAKAKAA
jgi:glycosyltransferase involved in cell wall biosynthesis